MLEYKQSVAALVPVRLADSSGNPVTGKVAADVSATALKSDGTTQSITATGHWTEITTGAFSAQGMYSLQLSAGNLDTTGWLSYAIAVTGALTYLGAIKVVANEEADSYALISQTSSSLGNNITIIRKHITARLKIHTSGSDQFKQVAYDPADNITVLGKWFLYDDTGTQTYGPNIFERVPSGSI
jgi:hypothetical protein